jgi:hypothetical protein
MLKLAGDETLIAGFEARERFGGGYFGSCFGVFRVFGDGSRWKR